MAAGLLDEAVDLAEPEAGTFTDILCREKWVERPRDHGLRHAAAGVGHGGEHVLAGCDAEMSRGVALVEMGVLRLDGEPAAFRHGVARI